MRFAIWQSVNFADCAFGWQPGAPMKKVWEGTLPGWSPTLGVEEVLDEIFARFQRVDAEHMPPEGYTGRSLSYGDVIQLTAEDDEQVTKWWACARIGWDSIPGPVREALPTIHVAAVHAPQIGRLYESAEEGWQETRMFISSDWNLATFREVTPERSLKVRGHSPTGFSWGYGGSGPAQMALAILLEVAPESFAVEHYQRFKDEVIATLDQEARSVMFEVELDPWLDGSEAAVQVLEFPSELLPA